MNTHRLIAKIAAATVLMCAAPVYAQVLGGNIGGGLGGTLTGGAHGVDAMTRGSVNGSISGNADGITRRGRQAVGATRDRVESKVEQAQDTSASVATSASATASGAVNGAASNAAGAADTSFDVAGSAAGSASSSANVVEHAGDAAEKKPQPGLTPSAGVLANGTLDTASQTDVRTDGSSTNASAKHDSNASGGVKTKRMDVQADAQTSSSVEAGASMQR
ncbi:MAG TPA: hypothetical protein VIH25_02655 [Steroidobacteraceae bacterium]